MDYAKAYKLLVQIFAEQEGIEVETIVEKVGESTNEL